MKALITGISGFAGTYLTESLIAEGYEVFGVVKSNQLGNQVTKKGVLLYKGDLLDQAFTNMLISKVKPDLVFHLASFTSPAESFTRPYETIINNIGITINLLESLSGTNAKILLVGSADEYGLVRPSETPVREDSPLRPTNPYAVSKISQDFLGLQYYLSKNMHVVRVRPGNHIGPGQRPDFVVAAFAKQIAEAEVGKKDSVIRVGNLEAIRDFTDVRDTVKAYILALLQGKSGEVYNLGSQKGLKIREILDKLIGLSKTRLTVEVDPSRRRSADTPKLIINTAKFRRLTGWKPKISMEQSLKDILDYWRFRVKE